MNTLGRHGDPDASISVATPPVVVASELLDRYLAPTPESAVGGIVVISGSAGSGRTHLAHRLIARAQSADNMRGSSNRIVRPVYVDVRIVEPHSIAEMIVDSLPREEIERCISDHLAKSGDLSETRLAQLLDPDGSRRAWSSLSASPTRRLGSEQVTALVLLYTGVGHRFVLVVDGVEDLYRGEGLATMSELRELLVPLRDAGALVFLTGRPDALADLLPDQLRPVPTSISMIAYDVHEASSFVTARLAADARRAMSDDVVERMVRATGGNPRKISDLCVRIERSIEESGGEVSAESVREISQAQVAAMTRPHVDAAIRRVLERNLWSFSRDYPVTIEPAGRVDFWIPVDGVQQTGCVVLVVDGVHLDVDVSRLAAAAQALDRSAVRYQALVVVRSGEEMSLGQVAQLRRAFGREPLAYVAASFEEDFAAAMKAMVHRFEEPSGRAALTSLPDRIDRLDRQQTRTQDLLAQVTHSLNDIRSGLDATRRAPSEVSGGSRSPWRSSLSDIPEPVLAMFDRLLAELADLGSPAGAVAPAFGGVSTSPDALTALRQVRNAPDEPLRGLGCVVLVDAVVRQFQAAIEEWFENVPMPHGARLGAVERRGLERICRRYDEAFAWLPVRELYGLRRLPRAGRAADANTWNERIGLVMMTLERLGDDVRRAALDQFER